MKKLIFLLAVLFSAQAYSAIDTISVKSKISDVTVFFTGAQINRQADLSLHKGKIFVMLDNLPVQLNEQSIQVKKISGCKILSVKRIIASGNVSRKTAEELDLEKQIRQIEQQGREISNKIDVYEMEEKLLIDNSILHKRDDGTNITELKSAADFYRARLNEIKQAKLDLANSMDDLKEKLTDIYKKQNRISLGKKDRSKLIVSLEAEEEISSKLNVTYYVPSAGWEPMYDFRVENITKPLTLVYNANVYQSSGEDWNNVNIKLSNNNPSLSGEKPELTKWTFGKKPEPAPVPASQVLTDNSGLNGGTVKGKIFDKTTHEPIPFANVLVEVGGVQVGGTTSDFDGNFKIKPLPQGRVDLKVLYVGYAPYLLKDLIVFDGKITFQDVALTPQTNQLEEVEITSYKVPLISKDQTVSGGTISMDEIRGIRGQRSNGTVNYIDGIRVIDDKPEIMSIDLIGNSLGTNVTGLEYDIDIPYTILSDGTDNTLKIKESNVPVSYVYHAIPKLDKDAFLSAEITDWSKLNLMNGKSSIYYQGTFVGESFINVNKAGDTMTLSLGRDKNLLVKREILKSVSDKKYLSNNIKETIGWEITLRNNTAGKTRVILEDQYPVSDKKWVEVELNNISAAKNDERNGKLTWDINLEPNETKKLTFDFTVKYPY